MDWDKQIEPQSFDPRAFAQRVLLAGSLEEKLAKPRSKELCRDGGREAEFASILRHLERPERPAGLEFKQHRKQGASLPHRAELINEESRARLLHFFCNHELLAVELMALALLKFPEAPLAFRRELLGTLLEEQQHTRWYLQRMQALGLEFGSLPLSGMIWQAIAPMQSPLDYVSRLSLTFEQANLDYALFYQRLFKQAGDLDSALILGKIYRDEITHVGTGAFWLRKWKEPGEADFACWKRQLKKPLSPVRARGNLEFFNAQGRRKAGLDEEFIEQVRLAAGTRGRQPDLWQFDALAELKWAGLKQVPRFEQLSRQFESVLFCFACVEDLVVQHQPPSQALRAQWADVGLILPRVVSLTELGSLTETLHREHHWAPTPESAPPAWRELFDKQTSSVWLEEFCAEKGLEREQDWQLRVFFSREELLAFWQENAGLPLALKAPFGAGGQGVRRLEKPSDWQRHARWLEKVLGEQGRVLAGRWLGLLHEGSAQFEVMEGGQLKWRGLIWTQCSRGGKFQRALAAEHPLRLPFLSKPLRRYLHQQLDGKPSPWQWLRELLPEMLEPQLKRLGYQGALGVDFLLYEKPQAGFDKPALGGREFAEPKWGFHPLNDLNARRSFGRAAWELWAKLGRPVWLELSLEQEPPAKSLAQEVTCLPLAEGPGTRPWACWGNEYRESF